jgi:hypothetical protein
LIGKPVGLTAFIAGRTDLSVWEFGGGFVEINEPYTSHTWTVPGYYLVALWAFNDNYPEGVSATVTIHVDEGVHYVAASNGNPVAPYISWATAATNIQDAVDVAAPSANIFVTNGVYAPVTVNKPVTLQSVNGPNVTIIDGGGMAQCAYLTSNAVMVGFTLTHGVAENGGGVYCESTDAVLTQCVLDGNAALDSSGGGAYGGTLNNCTLSSNSGFNGGGAYFCTLNNCTLTGNSANFGGGAYGGTLNNCTLTGNWTDGRGVFNGGGACGCILNNCTLTGNSAYGGFDNSGGEVYGGLGGGVADCTLSNCVLSGNSADYGGGGAEDSTLNNCVVSGNTNDGADGGTLNNCTITGNSGWGAVSATLNNCIVYFNSDTDGGNYDPSCTLNYCCTTPIPTDGVGNITNAPLLVNYAGGNLDLQSNSPCINSGNNAYVVGSTDLDGNPRIVGGTVDIGAYEYQTPVSMISYAWLQQYGLPIDTNTDVADPDGSGMNVYQDWIAGLNPTDAQSVLQMTSATATNNPAGLVVTWESVSGILYFLQCSTNLASQPAFTTIQSNIVGQTGTTSYTDTTAINAGPYFYRVGVQ